MSKPRLDLIVRLPAPLLQRVLDADLWRGGASGVDARFDADRFGEWLEVILEGGEDLAAEQLAKIDVDLVIAGIAQHARVFDRAALAAEPVADLTFDVGGYVIVAKSARSWNAIVDTLTTLSADHPQYFHRVMRGCVRLSNAGYEIDGLDSLLSEQEQALHDLAIAREQRREQQGFVSATQARGFLAAARRREPVNDEAFTATKVLLRAYRRDLAEPGSMATEPFDPADPIVDLLIESGVMAPPVRALLGGATSDPARYVRLRQALQTAGEQDGEAFLLRVQELGFLANTLTAGCPVLGRALTPDEATEAAAATCNLGLELQPVSDGFLVDHDLVDVFHTGWTCLHERVCLHTATQLAEVLRDLRCSDRDIRIGLEALRHTLTRHGREGAPWRARHAMDVLAILDTPAWAALLALIDECPVVHAAMAASRDRHARAIDANAFEFISETRQIEAVHEFLRVLPALLTS